LGAAAMLGAVAALVAARRVEISSRLGCYIAGMRRQGRILAIKWGMNPNSSSLGVDVTFLLVGATALAMITPVVGALLRWRKPVQVAPIAAPSSEKPAAD
jgi:hypothetical protein